MTLLCVPKILLLSFSSGITFSSLAVGATPITGSVKDARGNRLNGVFVTAEGVGASYRMTVFSDDRGQYRFPELVAGTYTVTAHASGFQDNRKSSVVVKNGPTVELEFTLTAEQRPEELFRQATPGEWLSSLPGTMKQKFSISKDCSGCHHNLYQLMAHRFTKQDWLKILDAMERIDAIGVPRFGREDGTSPEPRDLPLQLLGSRKWRWGTSEEIADYLAQVQGPGSPLPKIKFHPRPTGKATQAIITEYIVPRENAVPHDVQLDAEKNAWYNDFKANYLGKINPKTGEIKEYKLPDKPGIHPGSANMNVFPDSSDPHIWVSLRSQGRLIRFDPKTEKVTGVWERVSFDEVDSRNGIGLGTNMRVDLTTGKVLARYKYKASTDGYGSAVDSKGMGYRGGITDSDIKVLNPETGEVTNYRTPTPDSGPRRITLDGDDTLWFGEWFAGKIGTLDIKTGKIAEYSVSVPFAAFYEAGVDPKNHVGWAFDWHNDRLVRVNPRTGEVTEYPMPTRDVEGRRTVIDHSTNPPSVWIHGAGNGLIIRVQAP